MSPVSFEKRTPIRMQTIEVLRMWHLMMALVYRLDAMSTKPENKALLTSDSPRRAKVIAQDEGIPKTNYYLVVR